MADNDHVPVVQQLLPGLEATRENVKLKPRDVVVLQQVNRSLQGISLWEDGKGEKTLLSWGCAHSQASIAYAQEDIHDKGSE